MPTVALSPIDFFSNLDFTGLSSVGGIDLNNGFFSIVTKDGDSQDQGKGILLVTTDSAPSIPAVPDPNANPSVQWTRCGWFRRPFPGSADKTGRMYVWNADAPNDATYLHWVPISVDLTAITNAVNSALASADNAVTEAQIANATAANAQGIAQAANTTANNANATAATALVNAATAQTTADNATIAATNAQNTANAALTPSSPIAVGQLTPGNVYQKIWTIENFFTGKKSTTWFTESDNYFKATEIYAKGTDNPTVPGVGKNTRILNNIDWAGGAIIALNNVTGVMTLSLAGVYRIRAWAAINRAGANAANYQMIVANAATNLTYLTGSSGFMTNGDTNNMIGYVDGILNLATANLTIRLDMYTSTATGIVLGKAANVHPDGGGSEVYSGIEIWFLGA